MHEGLDRRFCSAQTEDPPLDAALDAQPEPQAEEPPAEEPQAEEPQPQASSPYSVSKIRRLDELDELVDGPLVEAMLLVARHLFS